MCHELLTACCAQQQYLLAALETAKRTVQRLEGEQQRSAWSRAQEQVEFQVFLRAERQKTVAEVAQQLVQPNALRAEFTGLKAALPTLYRRLKEAKWNDHDAKMVALPQGHKARSTWERRVDRTLHRQMCNALRARNSKLIFCLPLSRSIVLEHQHIPYRSYDNMVREQIVYDASVVRKACLSLKDFIPDTKALYGWEYSDELILAAIDNLDMYDKKTHTRVKHGECIRSHMLHAVVTSRILFDKSILPGPPPESDLLIKETEQVVKHAALPNRDTVHEFLRPQWSKHFELAKTCASPTELLARPPAACDRQNTGRTICVSLPILTGRSTASKVDVAAAINSVRQQYPGKKFALVMDYQTFAVAWWLKARTPELYEDVIIIGGELHRQFHTDDCIYRLWWAYVLEPAAMWLYRKDIKQSFNADRFNNKEKFVRLVTIAGLCWLSQLECGEGSAIPEDPVELLESVELNLPVWEFVSFLLYAGTFALSDKEAMRTANVSELDFAWGYTSILARSCHKTNYAKYGVLMNLVLHSSHPWIRAILDRHRTYRSSNLKCTGIGLEAAIEHEVRATKAATQIPSDDRLSSVNVAMTAKREIEHDYDKYYDVPERADKKQMVLDEDITALIEIFNFSFGSSYSDIVKKESWSKFAHRGVVKADCGAAKLGGVWAGIPNWVSSLTTSCGDRAPLIFEPPDVEDPNFIVQAAGEGSDDGNSICVCTCMCVTRVCNAVR